MFVPCAYKALTISIVFLGGKMKKLVVLTGAGVSAESGISTFRDNGGLWDNYDPQQVASIEGWYKNPGLMLDFYNIRRHELEGVRPNDAHRAIASLQDNFNVNVITQNVDNLHERAGSSNVLHLHGELTKVRPENCCNEEDGFSEKTVFDIGYSEVHLGDKAPNGHQLRPHIAECLSCSGPVPLRVARHADLSDRPWPGQCP